MAKRKVTKRDVLHTLRPLLTTQRTELRARVRALERELSTTKRALRAAMRPMGGTVATLCARLRGLKGSCKPQRVVRAPRKPRKPRHGARTREPHSKHAPALWRPGAALPAPTAWEAPASVPLFSPMAARGSDLLATTPNHDNGLEWDAGAGYAVGWGPLVDNRYVTLGHGHKRALSLDGEQITMSVARDEQHTHDPAYARVLWTGEEPGTFARIGQAALLAWEHPDKAAKLPEAVQPARDYVKDDPKSFAKRVLAAGVLAQRKPHDEERALLHSVYQRGQPWGLSWHEWGAHLLKARTLGLLELTRWDLTGDPATRDVHAVIDSHGREVHLLVVPPRKPHHTTAAVGKRGKRWRG